MRLLGRARGDGHRLPLQVLGGLDGSLLQDHHATVSDLRQGGKNIGPAKYEGRTAGGRKIFRYRLTK